MLQRNWLEEAKDLAGILLGTALCGIAFSMFLIPFKASPGGVGGIAQIFFYIFEIPAGIAMAIINIPLFIIGVISFGKLFGFKTIFAILSTSLFTELFSATTFLKIDSIKPFLYQINEKAYSFTDEYLLAVLAGSLLAGVGFGLVIKFNGSTGGTDIPALLLRKKFGLSIGNGYLIIDTVIIFLIGIVFKNGNLILWGLMALFISSKACDFIIEGQSYTKGVFIVTKHSDLVKSFIWEELERGCTVYYGKGAYSNEEREIIYTVIGRRELSRLKQGIKRIDSNAFVTINDVYEALGKGFRRF
jgi:uncharacterized membrane-anchored protein YitT (DUF2179 family)